MMICVVLNVVKSSNRLIYGTFFIITKLVSPQNVIKNYIDACEWYSQMQSSWVAQNYQIDQKDNINNKETTGFFFFFRLVLFFFCFNWKKDITHFFWFTSETPFFSFVAKFPRPVVVRDRHLFFWSWTFHRVVYKRSNNSVLFIIITAAASPPEREHGVLQNLLQTGCEYRSHLGRAIRSRQTSLFFPPGFSPHPCGI